MLQNIPLKQAGMAEPATADFKKFPASQRSGQLDVHFPQLRNLERFASNQPKVIETFKGAIKDVHDVYERVHNVISPSTRDFTIHRGKKGYNSETDFEGLLKLASEPAHHGKNQGETLGMHHLFRDDQRAEMNLFFTFDPHKRESRNPFSMRVSSAPIKDNYYGSKQLEEDLEREHHAKAIVLNSLRDRGFLELSDIRQARTENTRFYGKKTGPYIGM